MTRFKHSLLLGTLLVGGLAAPALAQSDTPEELAKIYACRAVADDAQRLACFDQSVGTLQEAEETGDVVALSKESIQETRREGFGLDFSGLSRLGGIFGSRSDSDGEPKVNDLTPVGDAAATARVETDENGEVTLVTYTVADASEIGRGRYRVVFENGQVWETKESKYLRFPGLKKGAPDTVTVRKAFAGSFMMRVNGKGKGVRVRRVK